MSRPINPATIMIYKIVRDYEKDGRKIHFMSELEYFASKVIDYANAMTEEDFWILRTPEVKEQLSKFCDLTSSVLELNEEKYENGGKSFAKTKIGSMPYTWLKGAVKTLKEMNEMEEYCKAHNVSMSIVHHSDGERAVSAIYWDKGPIIIGKRDEEEKD